MTTRSPLAPSTDKRDLIATARSTPAFFGPIPTLERHQGSTTSQEPRTGASAAETNLA